MAAALDEPTSALLVSAERALAAEFPAAAQARTVLSAIGSGERTFTNIGHKAGDLQQTSLNRSLKLLLDKRVVEQDQPLSVKPAAKDKRYRVADPYLRFWLAFLGPHMAEVERGRGDRVLARIQASWTSWRGRAIEPLLREALDRVLVERPPLGEGVVGEYWTRTNDPEIDIVVADRHPVAGRILGVESIKWLERAPFGRRDLARLVVHRCQLPGATDNTPLIVVARSGCTVDRGHCVRARRPAARLAPSAQLTTETYAGAVAPTIARQARRALTAPLGGALSSSDVCRRGRYWKIK